MIYKNILELIHKTPVVELMGLTKSYLKLESFNPMSSIKDRTAMSLIQSAIDKNKINDNTILIEATSGNTGIALSYISSVLGIKLVIVMPEGLSEERASIIKAFGVELIRTPREKGMQGSINKLKELVDKNSNYLALEQFNNPANPKIHMDYTAKEIITDFGQNLDVIVASVGTGGTITGLGKALKKFNPNIEIVAVEPSSKAVISKQKSKIYTVGEEDKVNKIQGIGAGFISDILDISVIDTVVKVSNKKAYEGLFSLSKENGLFLGISSGAVFSTISYLKTLDEYKNKTILGIAPDAGERYLSNLKNIL